MKIKEIKKKGIDVSHKGSNIDPERPNSTLVYPSVPCPTCGAYWFEGCSEPNIPIEKWKHTLCKERIQAMERFEETPQEQQEIEKKRLTKTYHDRKKGQLTLF